MIRVFQVATGNVGTEMIWRIATHSDLDLIGVHCYTPAKVGRDIEDGVVLTEQQAEHLDVVYDGVADASSLAGLTDGIKRLRVRLADDSRTERARAQKATETLRGIFEQHQAREQWHDSALLSAYPLTSPWMTLTPPPESAGQRGRRGSHAAEPAWPHCAPTSSLAT
jgi:hypothetical protein